MPEVKKEERLLDMYEAAKYLGFAHVNGLAWWRKQGLLAPRQRVGKMPFFAVSDLDRLAAHLRQRKAGMVNQLFTQSALARYLGVNRQRIHGWIKSGRLVPDKHTAKGRALFSLETANRLRATPPSSKSGRPWPTSSK